LSLDIPFEAIQSMPIDIALAILSDERQNNTRPRNSQKRQNTSAETSSTTKTATKRKHSTPKA